MTNKLKELADNGQKKNQIKDKVPHLTYIKKIKHKETPATTTNQNRTSINTTIQQDISKTSQTATTKKRQHPTNIAIPYEKSHHQQQKKYWQPEQTKTTILKENLFMKMQKLAEENLESAKKQKIQKCKNYQILSYFSLLKSSRLKQQEKLYTFCQPNCFCQKESHELHY